jgi:TolB protein
MKKTNLFLAVILITTLLFAQRNDAAQQINVSTSNYSGSLQNGSWSPDNLKLMCTNWSGGYNQSPANIFIIDLSDNSFISLTTDGESNVNMPGATWNADINRVVFSSEHNSTSGDQAFMLSPTDAGGTATKITPFTDRMCWEPGFSPNGDYIVYEAHYFSNETIGVIETYKVDGSQSANQLTDGSFNAKQPSWSPNGKIAYQVFDGSVWNIWTMNADGTNKQNITGTDAGDKTDATFSPNGEWIVYSSNNGTLDYANIFIKNISTNQLIQVTDYPNGYDGAPSWGTNNNIVFESTVGDPDTSSGATLWTIEAPINGTVGINTISNNNNNLQIYPNPTKGIIRVNSINEAKKISVLDISGRIIFEKSKPQQQETIDLSNFDNGIYIINILTDKKVLTTQIIKI